MKDLFGEPRRLRYRMWIIYSALFVFIVAGGYLISRNVINQPWSARTNVSSAVIGDQIYIVGGQSQSTGMLLDEVLRIDPHRASLSFVTHLPYACYRPATLVSHDYLFILGGYDGRSYRSEILQVVDGEAHVVARLPSPRSYGTAISAGNTLYYAGGWDGDKLLDEIVAIDLDSNEVMVVARLSSPRQFVTAGAVGDFIYFVGGEGARAEFSDEIVEFDPGQDRIVRTGHLPTGRYLTNVISWNNGLLVLAGKNTRFLEDVVFVTISDTAITSELIDQIPELSWRLAVEELDNRIFIIGGSNPEFKRSIRLLEYIPGSEALISLELRGHVWK